MPEGWLLLYGDECDVHYNPILGSVWHKRGMPYYVESALQNQKVHVFGALNGNRGSVVYQIYKRKRSVEFLEFLKYLLKRYRRWKIYFVLDNFKIHDTAAVREFVKSNSSRLKVVWLPTYSPHLNLIERFWRYMKDCTVRNYFFGDIVKLIQALHSFFRRYNGRRIPRIIFEKNKVYRKVA